MWGTNSWIANYLHYADNIVVVSDGVVRSQGTYDQVVRTGIINGGLLNSEPGSDTAATSQASLDPNDRAPRGKEANGQGDTTTAAGDFSVYRYYFRRVGWVKASVFVGFVIMEVFCSTFSRKRTVASPKLCVEFPMANKTRNLA